MASTGMIIDGILGSQCVDSSGEILDIEGADISDLQEGRGVLNYEHKGAEDSNGQEIVGKVLIAKKIFSERDCANDRERAYWQKVKCPFIYGICRLYDGAGHEGAKALAAQIRDHHANGEPILVRFSVEGSTLEREGNVLKRTVIRRVALTLKPCNRTADSGLIEDPNAPQGFNRQPVQKDLLDNLAEDAKKMEYQHPGYQKLGGAYETEYVEFGETSQVLEGVRKALTAGGGDVAPSQLQGGAALVREDLGKLKAKAMRVLKMFLDKTGDFTRAQVIAAFKQELPEVSDAFVEHFADIAEDYRLKLRKKDEGENPYPKLNPSAMPEQVHVDRSKETPGVVPPRLKGGIEMTRNAELMLPRPGSKRVKGASSPARIKLKQHFPDDHLYQALLKPDEALKAGHINEEQYQLFRKTIHEPWHKAMANWLPLNKALSEGKVPKGIIAKSVIFAAMSPNTPVPNQELFYGHYMDMLHEGKVDPFKPFTEDNVREFTKRSTSGQLPVWNRDYYKDHRPERYGETGGDDANKGELPQIRGLRSAHLLYSRLEHLTAKYKDDTQGIAAELMGVKHAYETQNKRTHPHLEGYGPKLTRYLLGMYGGGNMIVPDRHMIRSTFDLELKEHPSRPNKFISPPVLEKLQTSVFVDPKNEPFLRAIDHHFFTKHPAVKYVLETFPKHFAGREQQAIFPAFWLHWLTIGHYDRMRGRPSMAFNAGTDHGVFWDSVRDEMIKHGLHPHPIHDGRVQTDDFDFVKKAESDLDPWPRHPDHLSHPVWLKAAGAMEAIRQRWGETPALFAFFACMAPKLLAAETPVPPVTHVPHPAYHPYMVKMDRLVLNLRKAMADAAAGDRDLAEIAPHIHHVYVYRVGPGNRITRHQAGRFTTAGNHLYILEDYYGHLKDLLTEGPLTDKQRQQMAELRSSPKFDLASMYEINAGMRPELWTPPTTKPTRPASVFEFWSHGQERPDRLEFKDGRAHLNGYPLDRTQTKALLHHLQNGHATVRYSKLHEQAVRKMELAIETMMKADSGLVHATAVHEALSRLDELVRAGHLEPRHAEALRTHAFKDPMTDGAMGNKFAYEDFLHRADAKQGVHIVMDGNDFKAINDKFGHEVGDAAIRAMAKAARAAMDEAVGQEHGKLFRIGGDEFAAHVPTHEHAAKFARALRQKLEEIPPIQGQHKLSMSLGFGLTPGHADTALYEAKKQKYDPAGMVGADSRKWVSKYQPGSAPSMAHSLVPGFEGPIPLDHPQLHVKPPAPQPKLGAPKPAIHVSSASMPTA